jgi:hypothetical protein
MSIFCGYQWLDGFEIEEEKDGSLGREEQR